MSQIAPRPNSPLVQSVSTSSRYRETYVAPVREEVALDLKMVFSLLRRHVLFVSIVTLICLGVATFVASRAEEQYEAKATISLVDASARLTGNVAETAREQLTGGGVNPLLSQLELLRSRSLIAQVVESENLRLWTTPPQLLEAVAVEISPSFVHGDSVSLQFLPETYQVAHATNVSRAAYGTPVQVGPLSILAVARPAFSDGVLRVLPLEQAINTLLSTLQTSTRPQTNFIDVSFTDADPVLAQRVANAVVESYQRSRADRARQQSRRRSRFLQEQLAATDSLMREAQSKLSKFRQREQVFSLRGKFEAQQSGLLGLQVDRERLHAERQMYRSLVGQLRTSGNEAFGDRLLSLIATPGIAQNPVVMDLYGQLSRYETARDTLLESGRAATNPDVQAQNQLIANTTVRLRSAAEAHVRGLDARIAALDALRSGASSQITRSPEVEAEELRLEQELASMSTGADQLRDELQRARIAEAVQEGDVEIVDRAALPSRPLPSRRPLIAFMGLFLGLLVGSMGAFLLEHTNTAIRRREDLEEAIGLPGLAVIPQSRFDKRPKGQLLLGHSAKGNGGGEIQLQPLIMLSDIRSPSAEAYRTLRTNLMFSEALGSVRSLMVTSSGPAEGKTTTAANLAIAFAQQGMRVLLVDCDLRRPRLHTVFGLPKEPGLTQLVLSHRAASEIIHPTSVENLFLLPCGTQPPNPTELLGSAHMRRSLDELATVCDLMILDTPPLLMVTDAAILGSIVDGAILVVRAGKTERQAAQHARDQLASVGTRILGAVLNDPDAELPRYGGVYGYGYREGYAYYGSDD